MSEKFKVSVDGARCQMYGVCVPIDPDVFEIPDGSNAAVVLREVVEGDEVEDVQEAARACPAQAITVELVAGE